MPIRPENKARYPKNWKSEIVPQIRARSGNRCECTGQCSQQHGPDVGGRCIRRNGEIGIWTDDGAAVPSLQPFRPLFDRQSDMVRIVLTVMHLNHQPEDCSDGNLLHGCQGCHNRYDAPARAAGIKRRRHAERASGDLFQCEEASNA